MEKYKKMLSICGNVRTTKDYKKLVYNYIKENQDAVKEKITVFQTYKCSDIPCGGFCWGDTIEGHDFWNDVIRKENFDRFFERYPRLSKKVYMSGDEKLYKNVIKTLERRGGINAKGLSSSILKSQLKSKDKENIVLKMEKENLEEIISTLQEEIYNLELETENTIEYTIDDTLDNTQLETITLSDGSYTVGIDIEPGTYNLIAISGYGLLTGDFASGYLSESIGIDENRPNSKAYSGLRLTIGDEFTIKSNVTIRFTPKI